MKHTVRALLSVLIILAMLSVPAFARDGNAAYDLDSTITRRATSADFEFGNPHVPENTIRKFFLDSQGRNWYATPSNNKVGYFYLAGK